LFRGFLIQKSEKKRRKRTFNRTEAGTRIDAGMSAMGGGDASKGKRERRHLQHGCGKHSFLVSKNLVGKKDKQDLTRLYAQKLEDCA